MNSGCETHDNSDHIKREEKKALIINVCLGPRPQTNVFESHFSQQH